jgi:catechol 2,3-dioxygenase-like lactoylglutathione lyase family enzyme
MIKIKAHHMSFPVSDLSASKKFYQGILGLQEIPRPDIFGVPGTWLSAGCCEVHLIELDASHDIGTTPKKIFPGARHAAFEIEDYEQALAYLKESGLEVFETNPQVGQMWVADPDGHVIELIKPSV